MNFNKQDLVLDSNPLKEYGNKAPRDWKVKIWSAIQWGRLEYQP
jgi:hypothetical protein